jgi:hypothetical protein
MSAAQDLPAPVTSAAHRPFVEALGRIDVVIAFQFRHWPRGPREEAMAEARAGCWAAWHGLLLRGRDPVAVGVCGIAANACRAVRNGRTVGRNRAAGRTAPDIYHPEFRRATGRRVVSLERLAGMPSGAWQDWLASDNRYGPADEAAFRVDFAAWLVALPARRRRVAELLGEGLGTVEVARRLGVTAGAISQARGWLADSWRGYQGESPSAR